MVQLCLHAMPVLFPETWHSRRKKRKILHLKIFVNIPHAGENAEKFFPKLSDSVLDQKITCLLWGWFEISPTGRA